MTTAAAPGRLVDLVVQGGTVVNRDGSTSATVVIDQGRVTALLAPDAPVPAAVRVVDANGLLVLPGGVDPHCHIGQRLGEYAALDDYEQAGRAALWGGTTTMVDFAIPDPGESPLAAVQSRLALRGISPCDSALHGCVVAWEDSTADELASMADLGVRTVKMFTTYRDVVMAGADTILEAYIHAESDHVIVDAQQAAAAHDHVDSAHLPQTRPELAEAAAVSQVLATAEHVGTPVYFVHQTIPEAVDLVRAARRRGHVAYSETCPHYITLTDEVYEGPHPERFVCCPPIRPEATVAALRSRALMGEIDTLGSDHCCYSTAQKLEHHDDVRRMPNGLPGVETRLPVTYTTLVLDGGMSVEHFVGLFATNPARLNGLSRKGVIRVGADADLVLIDPTARREARAAELHMATDYTPYEGLLLGGWPQTVVSRGRVVVDAEGYHDPGPVGEFIAADPLPAHLLV
jgi:dihydropyrimidinase